MKNIFAKFQEYVKKPNRNVFDMSFRNNLTLKFGELTPVFCKEVIPGDSFKIHTAFGLQFMPMKFPVQTPMRAYIHFFYVRNRNLWKDWMDFIGGTKENLVLPYVTPLDKKKFFRVGGLADYLGVPNVLYGEYGRATEMTDSIEPINGGTYEISVDSAPAESLDGNAYVYDLDHFPGNPGVSGELLYSFGSSEFVDTSVIAPRLAWADTVLTNYPTATSVSTSLNAAGADCFITPDTTTFASTFNDGSRNLRPLTTLVTMPIRSVVPDKEYTMTFVGNGMFERTMSEGYTSTWDSIAGVQVSANSGAKVPLYFVSTSPADFKVVRIDATGTFTGNAVRMTGMTLKFTFTEADALLLAGFPSTVRIMWFPPLSCHFYGSDTNLTTVGPLAGNLIYQAFNSVKLSYFRLDDKPLVVGDDDLSITPYDSAIHLNALPFRAYEAIYNAYYRNPQNNPFVLDGVPEYNRYITTNEGGADTTQYDLYFRNWEYDFLTSAVQSPQQGIAPLVGMSMTGEATFADEEGNTYYAQAILNDEGEITGWQSHSSNMPVGSLRLLMDMAGTGISINDLRNVNAFQRFLENNIRHGLKYKDQVMSHFGVKIRYDELDMPEFIGGVSTSIDVNKLSQTSNSGDTPLGSFVGQASALAESNHDITHYCDEHGFIIGVMSVVPIPVYSQLLPKYFVKSAQLDYYYPEFGHIGYQPIQQLEVSPVQTFYADGDLHKVFGYNRAWYDYLASTDEVHSQFKVTMRDFIMNRTFDSEPELSEEFLLVDPDQLNDVFLAGTDDDLYAPEADKIIGSILFNVSAKRPIPLFGIPKLEG